MGHDGFAEIFLAKYHLAVNIFRRSVFRRMLNYDYLAEIIFWPKLILFMFVYFLINMVLCNQTFYDSAPLQKGTTKLQSDFFKFDFKR